MSSLDLAKTGQVLRVFRLLSRGQYPKLPKFMCLLLVTQGWTSCLTRFLHSISMRVCPAAILEESKVHRIFGGTHGPIREGVPQAKHPKWLTGSLHSGVHRVVSRICGLFFLFPALSNHSAVPIASFFWVWWERSGPLLAFHMAGEAGYFLYSSFLLWEKSWTKPLAPWWQSDTDKVKLFF